jgi:hypothetical protein
MAVLYGIAASLLGVVIGAFLTRWIDSRYERRREIAKAVAAALILREELKDARAGINALAKIGTTTNAFSFDGVHAWDEYRDLLLSAGMPHPDWIVLATTFRRLKEYPAVFTDTDGEKLAADDIEFLRERVIECDDAGQVLGPFIVETSIPFLRPDGIFGRRD